MKASHFITVSLLLLAVAVNGQGKIEATELPLASINFLREYFPSATVAKAKKHAEHADEVFEVLLSDGTEVKFWKDGIWLEVDGKNNPIPSGYIDRKIVDYVAQKYPDNKITHIDYGHKNVAVGLTNRIDLEFTKEGTFIK